MLHGCGGGNKMFAWESKKSVNTRASFIKHAAYMHSHDNIQIAKDATTAEEWLNSHDSLGMVKQPRQLRNG